MRTLVLLVYVAAATRGHAMDVITVDEAVREAAERNLNLLAERENISIAEARLITARLRPNPVLWLGLDYQEWLGTRFNTENNGGPPEFAFRTDFLLESGGKRRRRIEVAGAAKSAAELQFTNSMRTLILSVHHAFVEVLAAKQILQQTQENQQRIEEILEVNRVKSGAGNAGALDFMRAKVAALQFGNEVRQAGLRLEVARNRLQGILGRPDSAPKVDVAGDLRRDSQMIVPEELRERALALRPDLQELASQQARTQYELLLQMAKGKVDYVVGFVYHRQYGYAFGNSLGMFFSAPLPLFNRNQGEIERARREQRQVETRIRALRLEISNEIRIAYEQYQTSRQIVATIEQEMLKAAREIRDTTEELYRHGEATLPEYLDALRGFSDAMQSYTNARAEHARSLYTIDALTGKSVNP